MGISVTNGSSHVKDTSALLMEEFIRGTQEKGHEIHVSHAARGNIYPCIACDTCRKTGNGHAFKGGIEKLNPIPADAELVVFVTPLYRFGMSAQIRAVFDRSYVNDTALWEQQKKTVVLATCGDTEDWAFDTLKHHFEGAFRCMQWTCIGSVYALGIYVREDTEQSDYPREAYKLGRSL